MMIMLLRQVHSRTMGAILPISSGLHIRHLTCRCTTLQYHRGLSVLGKHEAVCRES